MQAKNIPDDAVLALIEADDSVLGLSRWTIAESFPDVPEKVLLAKLRSLVKRDLLAGCACGCRGDFTLPEARPA